MMKLLTFLLLFGILKLSRCQSYPNYHRSPNHHPNKYFIVRPNLYNTIEYSSHVPTILIARTPYIHPPQPRPPTQLPPPNQENFPPPHLQQSVQLQKQYQPTLENSRNQQLQQFQREQPKQNIQNYQNLREPLKQVQQNKYQQHQTFKYQQQQPPQQPAQLQNVPQQPQQNEQQPQQGFQPIHSQFQPNIFPPPTIYLIFVQKPATTKDYTDRSRPELQAKYSIPHYKSQSFKAESNLIQPGRYSKYPYTFPLPPPSKSGPPRNIKMVFLNGPSFAAGMEQATYFGHKPISAQYVARVYSAQKQPYLYQYKNNFVH